MGKFIDLIGQKFNRLTPIEYIGQDEWGHSLWKCVCNCGGKKNILGTSLITGNTKSCGCEKGNLKHGHAKIGKHSKTHNIWQHMLKRCNNKNNEYYKDYGGRKIKVCYRWSNKNPGGFKNFLEDMGECPSGKSIDRINNNLGYYKSNCRWATPKEQARNTRKNIYITYQGKKQLLLDWSVELNINYRTLYNRIYTLQWSVSKAFKIPVKKYRGNN